MGQLRRRGVGGANRESAGGVVDGGVGVDVLYWDGGGTSKGVIMLHISENNEICLLANDILGRLS